MPWRLVIALGLALPFVAGSLARAQPATVVGDAALLEVLLAAEATNRAAFPRGMLSAIVTSNSGGNPVEVHATVTWDGEKTHWEFELEEQDPQAKSPRLDRVQMAENAGTLISYRPSAQYAQIITDRSAVYREELRLRPDLAWFNLEGIKDWSELLDPGKSNGVDFEITQKEDRVVVLRQGRNGSSLRVEASLSLGGNIVEYEMTPSSEQGFRRNGSYEWSPDGHGNYRLVRYEFRHSSGSDPEKTYCLEVTSFDPDRIIAADRFELSSFDLADGTIVEEVGANPRTYRHGDVNNPQDVLEELARKLREEGFAAPDDEP